MYIDEHKKTSEARRQQVLHLLQTAHTHVTGADLALACGVTRQVIVADIALLRAAKHPIVATPQGYQYQHQASTRAQTFTRVIPVRHDASQTKEELYTFVDHGLHVLDVIVEHPIYGEMTGALRLKSRRDVDAFITALTDANAYLLSSLTDGVHLHTVEADASEHIDEACRVLAKKGILLHDS